MRKNLRKSGTCQKQNIGEKKPFYRDKNRRCDAMGKSRLRFAPESRALFGPISRLVPTTLRDATGKSEKGEAENTMIKPWKGLNGETGPVWAFRIGGERRRGPQGAGGGGGFGISPKVGPKRDRNSGANRSGCRGGGGGGPA